MNQIVIKFCNFRWQHTVRRIAMTSSVINRLSGNLFYLEIFSIKGVGFRQEVETKKLFDF